MGGISNRKFGAWLVFATVGYAQLYGHPDKVCEGLRLHLAHDLAAVNLQGDLGDAEQGGSLLVEKSPNDEGKDLPFSRRQQAAALLQLCQLRFSLAQPSVLSKG